MADTEKKTEKTSGLSLKMSIFLLVTCPVIVIVLSSVAIILTAGKIVPDDLYSFDEPVEYVCEVPQNDADAVSLITSLIDKTEAADDVSINTDTRVSFLKDSGEWEGAQADFAADAVKGVLGGISDDVLKTDADDCTYGEKAPAIFDKALLDGATLKEAELNEENGMLKVSVDLSYENSKKLFDGTTEQIGEAFTDAYKDVFSCETTVGNAGVTVIAEIDAVKGELKKLTSVSGPIIKCDKAKFINDFSELGEKNLFIETELKRETNITFAGIEITKDEMIIDPGSYDTVPVNINMGDDEDAAEITFTVSDAGICTVEEKTGVVDAVSESAQPAEITVTMLYHGHTYTDTCLVYIINEAEGVDISEAKLELKKGESASLSAEVTPKNATVKDVMWISSDESIATVDENGTVTAAAAGEVRIIAVTKQGHFMEACTVTVTE